MSSRLSRKRRSRLMLFADASRIDLRALRREATVPARLLGIGLPLTVAGALVAVALLGELTLLEAVVLAVVLAPADAALGQAVVTEKRLPSRIRQGLNVESGLNDGICVPLLLIALAAAEVESSPGNDQRRRPARRRADRLRRGRWRRGRRGGGGGFADGRTARLDRRRLAAGRAPRRCCCFIRSCSWARRFRVHRSLRRRWRLWIPAAPLRGEIEQLLDELGGVLDGDVSHLRGAVLLLRLSRPSTARASS